MSTHEIVLIGANLGGVPMVHYLMKHTIPQLNALNPDRRYHLTVITPNTSYYWKIAAPRALVSYEQLTQESIVKPFAKIFEKYSSDSWEHVAGKATAINSDSKTITVKLNDGGDKVVSYNSLIIATGTHYESALWTAEYGIDATISAQEATQSALKSAQSIMVAGGGPVGVETAGEIIDAYPKKKVYLVSGGKQVLERLPPKVSAEADRQLRGLNVELIHNKRVKSTQNIGTQTVVTFSDGSESTVDVYINAFAGKPIAEFIPEAWLANGHLNVDKDTLRATGAGAKNVYGLGDVNSISNKQAMSAGDSIPVVASSLLLDVIESLSVDEKAKVVAQSQSKGLLAWLLSIFGIGKSKGPEQRKYKTMEDTQIIPIAKSGSGAMMGYKIPGWFVHMAKGKTYLIDYAVAQSSGASVEKP